MCQAAFDGNLDLLERFVAEFGSPILTTSSGYVSAPLPGGGGQQEPGGGSTSRTDQTGAAPVHPQDDTVKSWLAKRRTTNDEEFGLWTPGFDTYLLRPRFREEKSETLTEANEFAKKAGTPLQYAVYAGQVAVVRFILAQQGAALEGSAKNGLGSRGWTGSEEGGRELFPWSCGSVGVCRWRRVKDTNHGIDDVWAAMKEAGLHSPAG